jgi:hypothetical protein
MAGLTPSDPDTRIPAAGVPVDENWARPLLDGLNVRYILSKRELSVVGFTLHREIVERRRPAVLVWENHLRRPRAEVLTHWRTVAGADEAATALAADPAVPVVEGGGTPRRGAHGEVEVKRYGFDVVEVGVRSPVGGLLLLRDGWHPGWTASVNREPTPVLRANLAFRAVAVPAGESTVLFRYRRPGFDLGLLLTLLSFPLLLVAWMYTAKRSR